MKLPTISYITQSKESTQTFGGYRHRLRISDGEWYDEKNLGSDDYPMLASRHLRGIGDTITSPGGLITKDSLLIVSGTNVIYNGYTINLGLSSTVPKQLVSMGAYLIILPDKKYFNTADTTDYGSIDATWTSSNTVTLTPCHRDGTVFSGLTVSSTAPTDTTTTWVDTSGETHVYREYSASSETWVQLATVYVKLSATDIDSGFSEGDGVTISGLTGSDQVTALNGSHTIQTLASGEAVIIGLLDGQTTCSATVTMTRAMPDMDYVCEASNRLWGCKYGLVSGEVVNELYCCKLGDFKNWTVYDGISTDAWAASIGSDGQWTGCCNYLGYPTFFKEDRIHRVYISSTGAHQVEETVCSGVEKGSWRSLCVAGEILYYKGRTNVYAYDGSTPTAVSDNFGDMRFTDARAGAVLGKYYISMKDSTNAWHLFCYDTTRGIWHREDATQALMFAACDDDLYYINATDNILYCVNGTTGTAETGLSWEAVSGVMNYEEEGHKYLSRYDFRVKIPSGSSMTLYLEYDSSGTWVSKGTISGNGLNSYVLPVIPKRCDHLRYKLTGTGEFKLFSVIRVYEQGSDM